MQDMFFLCSRPPTTTRTRAPSLFLLAACSALLATADVFLDSRASPNWSAHDSSAQRSLTLGAAFKHFRDEGVLALPPKDRPVLSKHGLFQFYIDLERSNMSAYVGDVRPGYDQIGKLSSFALHPGARSVEFSNGGEVLGAGGVLVNRTGGLVNHDVGAGKVAATIATEGAAAATEGVGAEIVTTASGQQFSASTTRLRFSRRLCGLKRLDSNNKVSNANVEYDFQVYFADHDSGGLICLASVLDPWRLKMLVPRSCARALISPTALIGDNRDELPGTAKIFGKISLFHLAGATWRSAFSTNATAVSLSLASPIAEISAVSNWAKTVHDFLAPMSAEERTVKISAPNMEKKTGVLSPIVLLEFPILAAGRGEWLADGPLGILYQFPCFLRQAEASVRGPYTRDVWFDTTTLCRNFFSAAECMKPTIRRAVCVWDAAILRCGPRGANADSTSLTRTNDYVVGGDKHVMYRVLGSAGTRRAEFGC